MVYQRSLISTWNRFPPLSRIQTLSLLSSANKRPKTTQAFRQLTSLHVVRSSALPIASVAALTFAAGCSLTEWGVAHAEAPKKSPIVDDLSNAVPTHKVGESGSVHVNTSPSAAALLSRFAVADAVEKVLPSVVNIRRVVTRPGIRGFFGGDEQSVEVSCGSGFFIDTNGMLLTNAHVVRGSASANGPFSIPSDESDSVLHVTLANGDVYIGRIVAADEQSDIALVKINADTPTPVAVLGDSNTVRAGEFVVAVGSPLTLSNSVSFGIVSMIRRELVAANGDPVATGGLTYLQLDVAINQGSSGGPCVSLDGAVIGICSMKIAGDAEGIAFAIPIEYARRVVDDLQTHGFVRRPYVGLTLISVTPELFEDIRQDSSYRPPRWLESEMRRTNSAKSVGLMVHHITKGGPGDRAGLRAGDVVIAVDNMPTTTTSEFLAALSFKVNKDCQLTVRRGSSGRIDKVTVRPELLNVRDGIR